MKKLYTLLLLTFFSTFLSRADQGMWLPMLIGERIPDMQAKGLKLSAEDIYSINQASLKDAIVLFGGGCTGEMISDEGLLLTNHHCGYSQIQSHSSVQHDYLTNGFWAMNRKEELPNPGLKVSFLVRMEEVTTAVLKGVKDDMTSEQRNELIAANSKTTREKAIAKTHYKASIEPLSYGNQYFLFVYEDFTDVRLVGAPPSAIGKFGGDTDNWMWPRHTGDFSLFRVYAGRDNKPADYAAENVPYKPRKSFPISTKGVKEGDFTFIYEYPARTTQYVLSDAVDYLLNTGNPEKITLRTERLKIMNEEQAKSTVVRIQYASKNASVANAWKKWQGESKGIARLGTLDKKRDLEERFVIWAKQHLLYASIIPQMHTLYTELKPYEYARDYYNEAFRAIEVTRFAESISNPLHSKAMTETPHEVWSKIKDNCSNFFKNYSSVIDSKTAKTMLSVYILHVPQHFQPQLLDDWISQFGGIDALVEDLFNRSIFASEQRITELLESPQAFLNATATDPAIDLVNAFSEMYRENISPKYVAITHSINDLYRLYMRGLMEMDAGKTFFPDANHTVAYGRIEGYEPFDAVYYRPQSTIEGIMEKDNPDIYDYNIPQQLRDLYATKDYGRWAVNGSVPVCFIATNHTTGGNSGSPVINGNGELIGLNFDRTWESTMSDIEFGPTKCRNISVDIRYVLFVIDKIGGAGYLLDEMKLIN